MRCHGFFHYLNFPVFQILELWIWLHSDMKSFFTAYFPIKTKARTTSSTVRLSTERNAFAFNCSCSFFGNILEHFFYFRATPPADSGAPTLNEAKPDDSDESVETSPPTYWNSGYWITTTPLPPITNLPGADKEVLCQFLGFFEAFRMLLFTLLWGANMEFCPTRRSTSPASFERKLKGSATHPRTASTWKWTQRKRTQ